MVQAVLELVLMEEYDYEDIHHKMLVVQQAVQYVLLSTPIHPLLTNSLLLSQRVYSVSTSREWVISTWESKTA